MNSGLLDRVVTREVLSDDFSPGLLTQAASTLDREQRKTLYAQAQKIVHDEAPWIFTFSIENLVATRKNIQGLEVNACPWWLDFTGTYVQR